LSCPDRRTGAHAEDRELGLQAALEEGGVLTPMEVVTFGLLLLVACNETTTRLIGNAVNALLDHPGQRDRVRKDPGLISSTVEETVRFDGPMQFLFRRTIQQVTSAGTMIPRNAILMPILGSANRDERQFAKPDVYEAGETPRPTSGSVLAFDTVSWRRSRGWKRRFRWGR
jgi:cytochrome P450